MKFYNPFSKFKKQPVTLNQESAKEIEFKLQSFITKNQALLLDISHSNNYLNSKLGTTFTFNNVTELSQFVNQVTEWQNMVTLAEMSRKELIAEYEAYLQEPHVQLYLSIKGEEIKSRNVVASVLDSVMSAVEYANKTLPEVE